MSHCNTCIMWCYAMILIMWMLLLSFPLIGFQSYELLSEVFWLLSLSSCIMGQFGFDRSAQVPWKKCYWKKYVKWSKAITKYFCNGINVLFPQVIYFKWTANIFSVCLLSLFIPPAFVMNSDELEWLLVGIKFLILFSNSHLISSH